MCFLFIAPLESKAIILLTPNIVNNLIIEYPAAPAPETTTLISSALLFTNLSALIRAALTTIAVPC